MSSASQPPDTRTAAQAAPIAATPVAPATPMLPIDARSLAIAVLTVTACILLSTLMLVAARPAQAIGQSDSGGDYKMLTMQVSNARELVIVVDTAAKKAIAYQYDLPNKKLEIAAGIPLDQLPKPPPEQPAPTRRRP